MATQKPGEWANTLIVRFEEQLPIRIGQHTTHSSINEEENKNCIIQISRFRFPLVLDGFVRVLKRVHEFYQSQLASSSTTRQHGQELEKSYYESIIVILETLEKCFSIQPKDSITLTMEENQNLKCLMKEICTFLYCKDMPCDNPHAQSIRILASKVLSALSVNFFNAVFNRISSKLQELSSCPDENPDFSDIELIQHINVDVLKLIKIFVEAISKFRLLKKSAHLVLVNSLEKSVWNWIESYPYEFAELEKNPNDEMSTCADQLFDILDAFGDNKKGRSAVWSLQMMLLVLAPDILQGILNAESGGAPLSPHHNKKKTFLDNIKRCLGPHSSSKQLSEAAAVTCVKLCKASTYINVLDTPSSPVVTLVQSVLDDLKCLLFNPHKPFSRGQNCLSQDMDLMIDCFVSVYKIKPLNNEALNVCLNLNSPANFHFVLVRSLYRIVTQSRLHWWPHIDLIYDKSSELRAMFTDTLNKVSQGYISHTPLRMIQITLKGKDCQGKYRDRAEEGPGYRNLLLYMVRLVHADPMLMLNNHGKAGHEIQSSTLELINGLVSLVHQPTMPEVAQEAMEALLVLHHPEKIEMWNPEAPINTFWDVSSQVMFSISQKLIQHQIMNYTEILKWLKEILICRNAFLSKHKEYANLGSSIAICKQAHIKLEVVFFMYLWSIDIDAILVAMSCFALLCQEAEIRCGSDEITVTSLVPNYYVYQELAQASTVLATGTQFEDCY